MRTPAPSLAPILRSATQGRLLTVLATDPERSYGIRELAQAADTSPTTVQREIDRAEDAGVVVSHHEGRNRRVRINTGHYLYQPLRQLLLATFGAPAIIADEFAGLRGAEQILLYGSWVARYEGQDGPPPRDIDVLVIGDDIDRAAVDAAADRAERRLALPVQATIRSQEAWYATRDPFVATVRSRPHMIVLTSAEDDTEIHGR
jgi:DNA-binding transcriptional ArsR family regulator